MMQTNDKAAPKAPAARVVLMYPSNQLKQPVRAYGETPSLFKVVNDAYFGN